MSDIDTSAEAVERLVNDAMADGLEDYGLTMHALAADNERLRRERDGAWNAALEAAANWLDEMRVSSRSRAIDGIRALKTPEADT